ncbi:alpha/beta hydrolase fold domain-containing protein [Nocardia sp. R7R-8]|uniref:alpha/beta hydrolase fold domain-containing protein n=1 Tax=Nocardia sp. R7R-8 TaxID=3459304 RepID=UPI00403D5697
MSFDATAFLDPAAFPEQIAIGNPRAKEYVELAVAATRRALDVVPAPSRKQYGPDPQQVIDVYDPEPGGRGRPAIIFMHGGGWTVGYSYWCGFMAPAAHTLNAVFLAPSYGLAPRRKYPSHLEDALEMLGWVHSHAELLGIDRDRIILAGHSAGGHLAALAALRKDLYKKHGLPAEPFRGAYSVSGSMTVCADTRPEGSVAERIYKYFLEQPDDDVQASPVYQIQTGSVPIHMVLAEGDIERIQNSTQEMYEKLRAVGTETSRRVLAGHDHYDTHLALADPGHFWWADVEAALI